MKTVSTCLINNMFMAYILKIFRHPHGVHLLQILVGSNKVGRIDHVKIGDQVGADLERLAQVEKFCPLLHVEVRCSSTTFNENSEYFTLHVSHKRFFFQCEPGDCLFFHCNILHRSDQNHSDNRRWAFLVSYNRADNNPVYKHHHPFYTPLNKVTLTMDGLSEGVI